MGLWTDIVGSVRGYIRLGLTGVRLKNSSGALAVRNAGDSADASLTCAGLTLSGLQTFAAGADIASATTLDLTAVTGNLVRITGTTATTGVTINNGQVVICYPTGAWPLTYHATTMPIKGGASYTCAAGDTVIFTKDGNGAVHVDIFNASGIAIQHQTFTRFTTGGSSTAYTLTPTPATTANTTGQRFRVAFHTAAGATPTLAVSGQTAANLKYKDSTGAKQAVSATQIPASWSADVEYDGTDWLVLDTPSSSGGITLGTPVATTSLTSIDFTGIPAGTKRITITCVGVSTSGTSIPLIRLGDSGGIETTGYAGSILTTALSDGFKFYTSWTGATIANGCCILTLENSSTNTWGCLMNMGITGATGYSGGTKALSGKLDRVSITTVGGSDTFDAGEINISYES